MFMQKVYKSWQFSNLDFTKDIENRGVANPNELPNYFYRYGTTLIITLQ